MCVQGFFYDAPNRLFIFPAPIEDGKEQIVVDLAVVPSRTTCFVDQRFFEEYADDIAEGALADLYRIKSAEWYDPQLAQVYARSFSDAVKRATARKLRGNTTRPMRLRARRFV